MKHRYSQGVSRVSAYDIVFLYKFSVLNSNIQTIFFCKTSHFPWKSESLESSLEDHVDGLGGLLAKRDVQAGPKSAMYQFWWALEIYIML